MAAKSRSARVAGASGDGMLARLARLLWVERALSLLALAAVAGFAISAYLTSVHYASVPLFCSTTGLVNCAAVTSSAYSVVPFTSIPITIPGMLFFAASGGLAVVALRRAWAGRAEPPWLRLAHVALGAVGLLFVLYLVYAEIVLLRKICEWCTAVHLLTLLTFLVALWRLQGSDPAAIRSPAAQSQPSQPSQPSHPTRQAPMSGGANHAHRAPHPARAPRNVPARRGAIRSRGHRR